MPTLHGYMVIIDGKPQVLTETRDSGELLMDSKEKATTFETRGKAQKAVDRRGGNPDSVLIVKVVSE
jgi:hypothetical protein